MEITAGSSTAARASWGPAAAPPFSNAAGAIAFVYLYVVPQLESSLTAEKLRRLDRLGGEQAPRMARALQSGASQSLAGDPVIREAYMGIA